MAIITKSDTAPDANLTVSLAGVSYSLTADSPEFHTTDPNVIANARADTRLLVEEDTHELAEGAAAEIDLNDPHDTASADHLSANASPRAIAAANANQALINEACGIVTTVPLEAVPSAAEEQDANYAGLGIKPYHPTDKVAVDTPPTPAPTSTVTPAAPPTTTTPASSVAPTTTGATS